jgi:inhibitor of KinA
MVLNASDVRFTPASDRSLLISFGERISTTAHRRVAAMTRQLGTDPIPGVSNTHPAYCSVLVVFDPLKLDHRTLEEAIRAREGRDESDSGAPPKVVELPVRYGGEFGPDLDEVAAVHGLTPGRVIELHVTAEYTAHFIGFVPGFAYLGGLPQELATPRRETPRRHVPPGSVGIAGEQTGVYTFATPGGWRLIGRTPVTIFRADREPMSLIEIGDHVRFVPVNDDRYAQLEREQ